MLLCKPEVSLSSSKEGQRCNRPRQPFAGPSKQCSCGVSENGWKDVTGSASNTGHVSICRTALASNSTFIRFQILWTEGPVFTFCLFSEGTMEDRHLRIRSKPLRNRHEAFWSRTHSIIFWKKRRRKSPMLLQRRCTDPNVNSGEREIEGQTMRKI